MLVAAAAWDELATRLEAGAASYSSTIAKLTTDSWLGPSSESMASAAASYAAWMQNTAARVAQTATQARAAAAAYETARASAVPPPLIEANRAQLAALVATNIFGMNSLAIAQIEAKYAAYWAQDTEAMHTYAASSVVASELAPFTDPPSSAASMDAITQALTVAVGTALAGGPPHRSQRAELPHWAPASGQTRTRTPRRDAPSWFLRATSRTRSSSRDTPIPALCPGRVSPSVFPLAGPLSSPASAAAALFGGFAGTTGPSDFPRSVIQAYRHWRSLSGPPGDHPTGEQ